MPDSIAISDWLIIGSTLVSPLLAVQAQKWIERARERGNRRQLIYETLMTTRGSRLDPQHVRALNQIDLEFSGKSWLGRPSAPSSKERAILEAWRDYADALSQDTTHATEVQAQAMFQRRDDAFYALLKTMSVGLGYPFDNVQIKRGVYSPVGYWETERRHEVLQNALARVLHGDQALSLNVLSIPQPTDEVAAQQSKLADAFIGAFSDDGSIRIEVREPKQHK